MVLRLGDVGGVGLLSSLFSGGLFCVARQNKLVFKSGNLESYAYNGMPVQIAMPKFEHCQS